VVELQEIFDIEYGHSLDLNKLCQVEEGVNFVSRTAKNNGVSAIVQKINVEPIKAWTITVSLGGSVLEAFLQPLPYYTGYHIFCLTEKQPLTNAQKLFYCMCIRANKYKYSYGRQANRTLKNLLVPSIEEIPEWVNEVDLSRFDGAEQSLIKENVELPKFEELTPISKLFKIVNGIAATGLIEGNEPFENSVMYVRPASTHLRTLRSFISKDGVDSKKIFPKGTLFVSTNGEGSHSYSYVSTSEFVPNSDVSVLIPKKEMSLEVKLFYARCITANRYLFSYGRKPKGNKLKAIKVPLLDETQMQQVKKFMHSLAYSKNIEP
jgi:hypothetical protein